MCGPIVTARPMKRLPTLHLKAALVCALAAIVLALPILWIPQLPAWTGWRLPVGNPGAEAILACLAAFWTAWCVVDIPRPALKFLVFAGTLWLLGSGIWLCGLFGHQTFSVVPLTAAGLAGAGAFAFALSPVGSRRARWESLVGPRVSRDILRQRINEGDLDPSPRALLLSVVDVLWPEAGGGPEAWRAVEQASARAASHFQEAGAYLERCDAEGARFVFGLWSRDVAERDVVAAAWAWVVREGGHAAAARGECLAGVASLPVDARWSLNGSSLRKASRMAAAARGYGARFLVEDNPAADLSVDWTSRRIAWWEFEGDNLLLREITGPKSEADAASGDQLRRWEQAWESFWSGDWPASSNAFSALARETGDPCARLFALRSQEAQREPGGA